MNKDKVFVFNVTYGCRKTAWYDKKKIKISEKISYSLFICSYALGLGFYHRSLVSITLSFKLKKSIIFFKAFDYTFLNIETMDMTLTEATATMFVMKMLRLMGVHGKFWFTAIVSFSKLNWRTPSDTLTEIFIDADNLTLWVEIK